MERIIAISEYLNEEYICRHCGQAIQPSRVAIEKVQFSNKKVQYSASCPDCYLFIKWMPQSIVGRLWYKGSMQEIAKFETSLLQWMLRVNYGNSRKIQKDIEKVLFERIDIYQPKDYDMNSKEQTLLNQIEILKKGETEILEKYNSLKDDIVMNSSAWDYFKVSLAQGKMKALYKHITKLRKELHNIKILHEEAKKNPTSLG